METKSHPKTKIHSKSQSSSKYQPNSRSCSKSPSYRSEVVETPTKSPRSLPKPISQTFTHTKPPAKSPEVKNLIYRLEGISIYGEQDA